MALVGAAVSFRLANFYQGALATALREELLRKFAAKSPTVMIRSL